MLWRWLGSLAASERSLHTTRQLGLILAFIAGAVNAGGFMVIGRYTSHMTGLVSSFATSLALDEHPLIFDAALFVASFIAGAVASAIFINIARTCCRSRARSCASPWRCCASSWGCRMRS